MNRTKETLEWEKDVSIDENSLDVEWLRQAELMMKYSKLAAKFRLLQDKAKESLDLMKASLDLSIRTTPEEYGLTKVTESAISNAITTDKAYTDCLAEYNQARYDAEIARAAVTALDHKKSALENLVKLFGQQYFAGPSIPRDITEMKEQAQRKRVQESNSKIRVGRKG